MPLDARKAFEAFVKSVTGTNGALSPRELVLTELAFATGAIYFAELVDQQITNHRLLADLHNSNPVQGKH